MKQSPALRKALLEHFQTPKVPLTDHQLDAALAPVVHDITATCVILFTSRKEDAQFRQKLIEKPETIPWRDAYRLTHDVGTLRDVFRVDAPPFRRS